MVRRSRLFRISRSLSYVSWKRSSILPFLILSQSPQPTQRGGHSLLLNDLTELEASLKKRYHKVLTGVHGAIFTG